MSVLLSIIGVWMVLKAGLEIVEWAEGVIPLSEIIVLFILLAYGGALYRLGF
ncbi:MAG: hypothetical protein F7C35_03290 [Desulfurococcales archaeon]|nr:hypothetical protein [Desulfurococcales archaeon]